MRISAYGLALDPPSGWDARIRRYDAAGVVAGRQLRSQPMLHTADFALPDERGDFGSGAVETMQPAHAFVALVEYHPDSARTALFAPHAGRPVLAADDFSPSQLQRTIRGQAGAQRFFVEAGRAFCLYVVAGSMAELPRTVPRVNVTLAGIEIAPQATRQLAEEL
ncbi:MAG: hypothetical protein ACR2KK_24030 [Acidimicrobiales bacterium]